MSERWSGVAGAEEFDTLISTEHETASHRPPMVTIALPVYNGKRWVQDAIEAILAQSYQDFEIVISDNCSTDGSYEICRSYARRDSRIRLSRNLRNIGVTENFNVLCRLASGKYFKYTSCNDLCASDFLLRCVEVLETHPDVVVCHPRARLLVEDTGESEDYDLSLHLMGENPVDRMIRYLEAGGLNNAEQGLIRLNFLRRTCLHKQYVGSDITMMAELSLYGKFYQVPEFLFYRRVGKQALSALRSPEELASLLAPGRKRLFWQQWTQMFEFSRMAFRVPLKSRDRLRLLRYVARRWRYSRKVLFQEIREALRAVDTRQSLPS